MVEIQLKCDACGVQFERKTPRVETKHASGYHAGCWAKINRAIIINPGPEELLFMREPLADQVNGEIVTFKVNHS